MAGGRRTTLQRVTSLARTARDYCGAALDDLVYAFNPEAGVRRKVMRSIMQASERRLAMSADDDRDHGDRLHGPQRWNGSRLSADSELEQDLESVRTNSRELYRTTCAGGAFDTKVDHVVGKGFTYRPKIKAQPGISAEAAAGFNTQLLDVHNRWAQRCDITGKKSLWELSRLVQRSIDVDGESFTVMWAKRRPGQPIPLVLEVVDAERICTPPDKSGDPLCRMGIQTDADGEITGYWLRTTHPFDTKTSEFKWDFIPADRMLHVFEAWFAGQSRGYPWMQRTLSRWRDGEDLDEAGIVAAQVEACHAAFIKTRAPGPAAQAAATVTVNGQPQQTIKPGGLHYVQNGQEEIVFSTPTKSNIVGTLHEWNHRRIAAGMDWPYEFLMKDWRGTSFAGGRLILHGAKVKCQVSQMLLDVGWLMQVANEVTREAILFGAVDINASAYQQRPWVYEVHRWTPQAFGYALNPGEEVDAKISRIEHNLSTLDEELADEGDQLEDVLNQRKVERDLEKKLGIEPAERVAQLAQQGQSANKPKPESSQQKEQANAA